MKKTLLNKNGRIVGKTTKLKIILFQCLLFKEPPRNKARPRCHKIVYFSSKRKQYFGGTIYAAQRLSRPKSQGTRPGGGLVGAHCCSRSHAPVHLQLFFQLGLSFIRVEYPSEHANVRQIFPSSTLIFT